MMPIQFNVLMVLTVLMGLMELKGLKGSRRSMGVGVKGVEGISGYRYQLDLLLILINTWGQCQPIYFGRNLRKTSNYMFLLVV